MTIRTGPRLAGHVSVITGSGQGVGRGIALALAKDGASVVLAARTLSKVESVRDEIAAFGGTVTAIRCDVTVRADVEAAVAHAVDTYGGLDSIVNNAQSSVQQPVIDITDEDVEINFRTGAMGTLYGMQAAFPRLVARGGGSIVNFGSSTAIVGDPGLGAYAMNKEAIRGLTRVASREWGPHGIRVNVIVPTAYSPGFDEYFERFPAVHDKIVSETPLGRLGDPETDIGRTVAALVSDDITFLTGATLMLGGGREILG